MVCYAVQNNLKLAGGNSGLRPYCVATLAGFFIGANSMKKIPLTKGKFALVDAGDLKVLSAYKWHANKTSYGGYRAVRSVRLPQKKMIYMHRQIMNAPIGLEVDHVNHNTLDNRKENLRLATHSQNQQNRRKKKISKGRYKGISWDKQTGMWRVILYCGQKAYRCGRFNDEIEAAKVYDRKAKELFGEFANTNF